MAIADTDEKRTPRHEAVAMTRIQTYHERIARGIGIEIGTATKLVHLVTLKNASPPNDIETSQASHSG
jgi:hypothetical protein